MIGYKNLIKALSEASPIVGLSNQGIVYNFTFQSLIANWIFYSFCSGVKTLSFYIFILKSYGNDGSNIASEQKDAHSNKS